MAYRFLKILFVLLILITAFEFGYYIYYFKNSTKLSDTKTIENNFLGSPILDTVKRWGVRSGQKVYLIYEQEGVIKNIFFQEGNTNPSINIYDNDGKRLVTIVVNPNVKFIKKVKEEERVIDFKDLKEGDKIIIRNETNLLNNRTNSEYFIY